jgi:L1 cell adhesion molecule like protein
MIEIMDTLQKYVPVHTDDIVVDIPGIGEKTVHADSFHHILFGGDMLTAKRARGSKFIRSNSARGLDQLQGLLPVVEDWHTKVCLLGVSGITDPP